MKLGDFGLAIDAKAERPKSRVGTLDYMAPEVVCLPTADERRRMEREGRPLREADMPTYTDRVDTWAVRGGLVAGGSWRGAPGGGLRSCARRAAPGAAAAGPSAPRPRCGAGGRAGVRAAVGAASL
jgi:hypothetical protein